MELQITTCVRSLKSFQALFSSLYRSQSGLLQKKIEIVQFCAGTNHPRTIRQFVGGGQIGMTLHSDRRFLAIKITKNSDRPDAKIIKNQSRFEDDKKHLNTRDKL